MTVGRRLFISLSTLVACAAVVGGVALTGMFSARQHHLAAEDQYEQLRSLYEVGHHAATARTLLNTAVPSDRDIRQQFALAIRAVDAIDSNTAAPLRQDLSDAAHTYANSTSSVSARNDLNRILNTIASSAGEAERDIIANREQATAAYGRVLLVVAVTFCCMLGVAIVVGIRQYRAILKPLRTLEKAVTQNGRLALRSQLTPHGDREFQHVMEQFKNMSSALAEIHASLQEQVETRTRQLVRSEQLASVGTLAAGLAHEINNPLGIIAGYAESSLRRLEEADAASAPSPLHIKLASTLSIICDEAFRCRDITRDLLHMARPRERELEIVHMASLIERAIHLVQGLPVADDREIVFSADDAAANASCRGERSQLLQVVINLLTNALEATSPNDGQVRLNLTMSHDALRITITDNGCGMQSSTLEHAFDPFFTSKQQRGQTGCGLGLSISHAIVQRHAGKLFAHSDGYDRGSTFTLELPLLEATPTYEINLAAAT